MGFPVAATEFTAKRLLSGTNGTLNLCLGQENKLELRPLLRNGISDDELKDVLINAIRLKPEKHKLKDKPDQVVRLMSMTGG